MRKAWAGVAWWNRWMAGVMVVALAVSVRAQSCGRWEEGPDRGVAGVVGVVYDMLVCDPDGEGPMGTMLVVAGDFEVAGDIESRFVAGWDGTRWQAMGSGLQYGVAYALTMHEGRLYVAGSFSGSALSNVAWWDGSRWQFVTPGPIGDVRAMRSYRGELVVGGNITGVPPNLRAVGVAAWNGSGWRALGEGLDGGVTSFTELGGRLIAGGSFTTAGGTASAGVAAWDGARWSVLGAGGIMPRANGSRVVLSLRVVGNELFIGGMFESVGGAAASGLARWDGAAWSAIMPDEWNVGGLTEDHGRLVVSTGTDTYVWNGQTMQPYASVGNVYRSAEFRGAMHLAGDFRANLEAWRWGVARRGMAGWEGLPPGIDSAIVALIEHQGRVVVGGGFEHVGSVAANRVAAWDGAGWSAMGNGLDGTVRALTTFRGQLVAAGDFTSSGGVPCSHVATWDGVEWRPTVEVEVPGSVVAIAEHRGQLVFAVQFPAMGMRPAYFSVYVSDGTGLVPIALEDVGTVTRFFLHEGRLLVGGNYASIGGLASRNLAAWDGEGWVTVDTWQRGPVLSMGTYQGDLVVGASFRDGVWRLSSQTRLWSAVGRGLSSGALALVEYHGRLVAVGGFHLAEGQIANGLAAWNGTAWRPFGIGMSRQRGFVAVAGAIVFQDQVFAVGEFDHVDGVVSVNWARWKECPADVDDGSGTGVCDGGVSIEDLFYYVELFGAGDLRADIATRDGEIGGDGEVTPEDLSVFLDRFAGGC